jgi:hypothetical protein
MEAPSGSDMTVSLHGVITQKTTIIITTAVKTSEFKPELKYEYI